MTTATDGARALLLDMIESAYRRKGWHGTTLRGALRGLDAEVLLWRPAPRRHNIWEVAVHAAYWKYAVTRRVTGARRGSFALPGSNWFASPRRAEDVDLHDLVALLDAQHDALVAAVHALPSIPQSGRVREMLYGIAAHDLYHTGQIQLLKRLARDR